ncbi:hypothetical protein Tco_1234628 [Tanacetum coccineum]
MLGRKRAIKEQQKESSKKLKVEEEKESGDFEEDDEVELKRLLVIKKDEDIAIDAIPLATKLPVIVDYKLHKKANHNDTRPEDEFERVLWGDLKVMFEPDITRDSKVTTVSIKISTAGTYYCLCSVSAAGYKDTTVADL